MQKGGINVGRCVCHRPLQELLPLPPAPPSIFPLTVFRKASTEPCSTALLQDRLRSRCWSASSSTSQQEASEPSRPARPTCVFREYRVGEGRVEQPVMGRMGNTAVS